MSRPILIVSCLLLAWTAAVAQLRVDVRLVNVVATVTDERGRYVSELTASDFRLKEDGVTQPITHFSSSHDQPVSVGIVLDTSTSMERKIATAIRAVDRFLRDIHTDDEIFLMTFDGSVKMRQEFTSNRDKLWAALDKVKLGSNTSLFDAVIKGTDSVVKGKYPKKAMLLISDGVDTASDHNAGVAILAVRESEILVYALGIAPEGQRDPMSERTSPGGVGIPVPTIPIPGAGRTPSTLPGPGRRQFPGQLGQLSIDRVDMETLDELADASGGKAWLITGSNRRDRIQDALDEIADELRSQYNIGYYPAHDLSDGKWHHIELTLKNDDYRIRYKQDYLGK